jgi:hypothetical protein
MNQNWDTESGEESDYFFKHEQDILAKMISYLVCYKENGNSDLI